MVMLCLVQSCINSNRTTKAKGCRLFSVPKDVLRCNEWLINCGRQDLLNKSIDVLAKYYRVCLNHFSDNMFSSADKSRLLPKAVPTEFKECNNVSVEEIGPDISIVGNSCLDETIFDSSVVTSTPTKENQSISVTLPTYKELFNQAESLRARLEALEKKLLNVDSKLVDDPVPRQCNDYRLLPDP
ncbi:hypothetical protein ACI65C_011366 [Semiaphis heraclei]